MRCAGEASLLLLFACFWAVAQQQIRYPQTILLSGINLHRATGLNNHAY